MSTNTHTPQSLNVEATSLQTAPGVTLTAHQNTLIGSVLDLFAGRATLPKLGLWADTAVFEDPLTIARGKEQFSAQWYGLQSAFSEIERVSHQVRSSGNPMVVDLRQRYVVKGIGKEQLIQSVVEIWTDGEGKIEKVVDKWDGKLPEGGIANAFRRLNAVTVPKVVSVPKNEEEDAKKGN